MAERMQDDEDLIETHEWLQAIDAVIQKAGLDRAHFLLHQLQQRTTLSISAGVSALTTDYINTIAVEQEPDYPGNLQFERRIRAVIRWNAAMMVLRASRKGLELGGHIASFGRWTEKQIFKKKLKLYLHTKQLLLQSVVVV